MFREEKVAQFVRGRQVLDIGSIGQTGDYCLWDIITKHAGDVVGVDLPDSVGKGKDLFRLQEAQIAHQNDRRIVYGNMETLNLGRCFDVAVAGDVIEHVSNQGLFLDNIHRHLGSQGRLLLTTPNAKWITVLARPNPTHALWHDRFTLTHILSRHGFEVEEFYYYLGNKSYYSWWKRPLVARQGMLVIARKASSSAKETKVEYSIVQR